MSHPRTQMRVRLAQYKAGQATFDQTARTLQLAKFPDLADWYREQVEEIERDIIARLAVRQKVNEPEAPERKITLK